MVTTKRKSAAKRITKNKTTEAPKTSSCQALQISIKMGVLIAFTIFLLTGVWGIREYIHTIQEPTEMSFTGIGDHVVANNTAKITFSFSDRRKNITTARDTVTKRVQDAYAALTRANIAEKDIQTTGYTIYPEYRRPTPEQAPFTTERSRDLLGYRISHTTTAVIRDIENIGTILAILTNLNPETLTGPFFSAGEEQKRYVKDIATIKAIHDAKVRAHKIARTSNLRLKKITHINIYENQIHQRPYAYAQLESASTSNDAPQPKAVPIEQGEQKIQQTAIITYEIEERKKWSK